MPQKVVALIGKPCYQATCGGKGETTTVVAAFNIIGIYMKPFIIMKGKCLMPEWIDGLPPDITVILRISNSGWITKYLFMQWAEQFTAQLPKDELPHILFLDGHSSRLQNRVCLTDQTTQCPSVVHFTSHDTLDPASRSVIVHELQAPLDCGRSENS